MSVKDGMSVPGSFFRYLKVKKSLNPLCCKVPLSQRAASLCNSKIACFVKKLVLHATIVVFFTFILFFSIFYFFFPLPSDMYLPGINQLVNLTSTYQPIPQYVLTVTIRGLHYRLTRACTIVIVP